MGTVVWNRLAQRRGELLSRELDPERHAAWWARRHDGWHGRLNRWVDRLRDTTLENVPYVDPTDHPPRRLPTEVVRAKPRLGEFLDLLGSPPAEVVLLGAPAAKAWDVLARRAGLPWQLTTPTVSRAPHPNPLVHDRLDPITGRRNGDRLVEVLRGAARRARGEAEPPARASGRRPF